MRLILGSASPRRLELLAQIGVKPDLVLSPDIDETPQKAEAPRPYCERMARQKARAITPQDAQDLVLCADTTVAVGRRILGKPHDKAEAAQFLDFLGGRRHRVLTCVALRRDTQLWTRTSVSTVKMKRLSNLELNAYLNTDEWHGKAGGYAIQGRAGAFVSWISGSYSAIMGLPLNETATLLTAAGWPVWAQDLSAPDLQAASSEDTE